MWQILKHFSRHFRQAHTQKLLDVNILMLNIFSISTDILHDGMATAPSPSSCFILINIAGEIPRTQDGRGRGVEKAQGGHGLHVHEAQDEEGGALRVSQRGQADGAVALPDEDSQIEGSARGCQGVDGLVQQVLRKSINSTPFPERLG